MEKLQPAAVFEGWGGAVGRLSEVSGTKGS